MNRYITCSGDNDCGPAASIMHQSSFLNCKFNCSERILRAVDQGYDLNLPITALRLSAGFGGGFGIGSTCGLLSGGILALGALFARDTASDSPCVKKSVQLYVERFQAEAGTLNCTELKPMYRSEITGCDSLALIAAGLLDTVIRDMSHPQKK